MTDHSELMRLAERVESIFLNVPLGRMEQETKAIATELRQLAERAVPRVEQCCICGKRFDAREEREGGGPDGAELRDGRWACSSGCWEIAAERAGEASGVLDWWRCFHCDEAFTDAESAALHFGTQEHQEPACLIDIAKFREMEALQLRYLDEDADVHRTMRRMETDHQQALRRAEETGYAEGLVDAVKYPQDAAPTHEAQQGGAADASRYRWLRDVSVPPHNFYISVPVEFADERYTPAEVDKAIDQAIAALTPQANPSGGEA